MKSYQGAVGRGAAGFSMLEILIVIGLVGGLAAVTLGYYTKTSAKGNAQTAISDVSVIATAVRELAGFRPDYTGITEKTLVDADKLPERLVLAGTRTTSLVNPWGGAITVAAASPATQFLITLTRVPVNECNSLVRAFAAGYDDVLVDDESMKTASTGTVVTACAGSSASGPGGSDAPPTKAGRPPIIVVAS